MIRKYKKFAVLTSLFIAVPFIMIGFYQEEQPQKAPSGKESQKKALSLPANPHLTSLLENYEHTIEALMKRTGIPGSAVVIVKDSSIIYIKGFGVKRTGTADSIDCNTVFRIGSVSKCFASVLTGIMVHEGALSWNDPVIQYLPDFALKSEENTELLNIMHVLSHTTGLPYHTYTNFIEEGVDLQRMLYQLRQIKLHSKPGKLYSYQNVAYSLIGEVLQSAAGKTYQELMREKVFDPLGMKNASLTYDDIIRNGNVAQPHLFRKRRWRPIPISDKYYNAAPAGGVNASITDMAHWLIALLGNRQDVVTSQTLTKIFTPVVDARSKNRSYRKVGPIEDTFYALGWRVLSYPNDTIIYHGGYVNGYRSEVAIDLNENIGICILANAPGDVADKAIPEFLQLYFDNRDAIKDWENEQIKVIAKAVEPAL